MRVQRRIDAAVGVEQEMSGNWSKMTTTTGGVAPKATSSAGSSSDVPSRPAIPGLSRNAAGTTTRAGERKVANRRSGASATAAARLPTMIPAAGGRQPTDDPERKRSDGGSGQAEQ